MAGEANIQIAGDGVSGCVRASRRAGAFQRDGSGGYCCGVWQRLGGWIGRGEVVVWNGARQRFAKDVFWTCEGRDEAAALQHLAHRIAEFWGRGVAEFQWERVSAGRRTFEFWGVSFVHGSECCRVLSVRNFAARRTEENSD